MAQFFFPLQPVAYFSPSSAYRPQAYSLFSHSSFFIFNLFQPCLAQRRNMSLQHRWIFDR
jgi:hypothetical protein